MLFLKNSGNCINAGTRFISHNFFSSFLLEYLMGLPWDHSQSFFISSLYVSTEFYTLFTIVTLLLSKVYYKSFV